MYNNENERLIFHKKQTQVARKTYNHMVKKKHPTNIPAICDREGYNNTTTLYFPFL